MTAFGGAVLFPFGSFFIAWSQYNEFMLRCNKGFPLLGNPHSAICQAVKRDVLRAQGASRETKC